MTEARDPDTDHFGPDARRRDLIARARVIGETDRPDDGDVEALVRRVRVALMGANVTPWMQS